MFIDHGANNRPSSAQVISIGSDGSAGIAGMTVRRDVDVYRFTATADGPLNVSLTESGKNPIRVTVRDAQSPALVLNSAGQGSINVRNGESVLIQVQGMGRGSGFYQLQLQEPVASAGSSQSPASSAPAGSSTGSGSTSTSPGSSPSSGTLTATSPGSGAESEPNNSFATATPFSIDSDHPAGISGTLSSASDVDNFVVTPTQTGRINFTFSVNGPPVRLRVLDSSGNVRLTLFSDQMAYTNAVTVVHGQTYYVEITPETWTPTSYSVGMTLRLPPHP